MLVAHSMGNLNVANNLWKMSQSDKDKMIARYIAIAPPFIGAAQAINPFIGFSDSALAQVLWRTIGVTPEMFKYGVSDAFGGWNLMPRNTFKSQANKDWMKAIKERMAAEKAIKDMRKGTVMDIFPSMYYNCNEGFKDRVDGRCRTAITDFSSFGAVNKEAVRLDNMKYILGKYGISTNPQIFYDKNSDSRFDNLNNLGV